MQCGYILYGRDGLIIMLCMIQKYMVDLLTKALNEEEGQAVKVEQIDTITDGSLQVNVYKFKRQE